MEKQSSFYIKISIMSNCKYKKCLIVLSLVFILFVNAKEKSFAIMPGDIDNDGFIKLSDSILILQLISNSAQNSTVYKEAGIHNDNKIHLDGAIYVLQTVAGLRVDEDNDGFAANIDCNDSNAAVNPGAIEICDDITDNDCDNLTDCEDADCNGDFICMAASCDN
jgi:hypothetical protein